MGWTQSRALLALHGSLRWSWKSPYWRTTAKLRRDIHLWLGPARGHITTSALESTSGYIVQAAIEKASQGGKCRHSRQSEPDPPKAPYDIVLRLTLSAPSSIVCRHPKWLNFNSQVEAAYNAQALTRSTTAPYSPSPHLINPEIVHVGDEHGLQAASNRPLAKYLEAQGVNICFGDFKCAGLVYVQQRPRRYWLDHNTRSTRAKVGGEIKVPWVWAHSLAGAYNYPDKLRRILAQPLPYMQELGSAFGFLSNHKETIFLRQTQLPKGTWHVEYSPVSHWYDVYRPSAHVSMKQPIFYVAKLASRQGPVDNQTPRLR
ncbi:unnamed protein product [Penicillium egyptiacum]|uniref:Uncharacterized protein n=1 Tax=Penicillium egyptiacum TaxID=1303716 RepID=A0A9W4P222_9EURO|nr:unnamed protein product [Penicillium egyptiacum]